MPAPRTARSRSLVWFGDVRLATGSSFTAGHTRPSVLVDAADLGNKFCDPAAGFNADRDAARSSCANAGAWHRVAKSQAVADAGGAGMILFNNNDQMALVTDNHFVPSVLVDHTTGMRLKAYVDRAGDSGRGR